MACMFHSLQAWGRRIRASYHRVMAKKHFSPDGAPNTIRSHKTKAEHSSDTIQNDVLRSSKIHVANPSLTDAEILEYQNYQKQQKQRRTWSKSTNGISKIHRRPSRKYAPYAAVANDIKVIITDYSDPAAVPTLSSAKMIGFQDIQNDKARRDGPRNGIPKLRYRK
ncbi:hypothetical protein PMIN01_11809 [Paraphaeosphaeria minitans]|uniref:Uncharacterized protein n=1 Tax=Paraphaeosphaeria minitans TaxID=565426 RepID=A0A9P6G692_9PLEO|nr:hypothetical protein PMIN01_11809 [Paraphaeosphaeria minitans]